MYVLKGIYIYIYIYIYTHTHTHTHTKKHTHTYMIASVYKHTHVLLWTYMIVASHVHQDACILTSIRTRLVCNTNHACHPCLLRRVSSMPTSTLVFNVLHNQIDVHIYVYIHTRLVKITPATLHVHVCRYPQLLQLARQHIHISLQNFHACSEMLVVSPQLRMCAYGCICAHNIMCACTRAHEVV